MGCKQRFYTGPYKALKNKKRFIVLVDVNKEINGV